ncbi:MAG: hypothetical protein V4469_00190 [Patescibacteria group bacterium]
MKKLNTVQKQILAGLVTLVVAICIIFSPNRSEKISEQTASPTVSVPASPKVSPAEMQKMVKETIDGLKAKSGKVVYEDYQKEYYKGVVQSGVTLPNGTKYHIYVNYDEYPIFSISNTSFEMSDDNNTGTLTHAKDRSLVTDHRYGDHSRDLFKMNKDKWQSRYVEILKEVHAAICPPKS